MHQRYPHLLVSRPVVFQVSPEQQKLVEEGVIIRDKLALTTEEVVPSPSIPPTRHRTGWQLDD